MHQTSSTSDKTLASFHQQTCDLYVGKLLGGKYEIIEKIAVGGWSTIYKAKRRLLNIDDVVAVKILHINLSDNPQDIKRFYNEASTICELRHPHAIHLYDFDRDANGTIYMAMEFIHGRNLKETIRDVGPFNVARMLHIIFQVCDVISVAHKHQKKIIHRDITPQNIMLSKAGELGDFVKVLDFGIAKLRTHDSVSLTGSIVGTPLYMAPEQWRGGCDERTDIYSLGTIMYEMLTGKTPFSGDQITLMNKHLNEKPPPFRKMHQKIEIPKYIEHIIFDCLEKNKDKRPQSVDELKSLLQSGKSSFRLKFTNYSKSSRLGIILIFLSIPLALYTYLVSKEQKENTAVPNNLVSFLDAYKGTPVFQKNDNDTMQTIQDNIFGKFPDREMNKNNGLYNNNPILGRMSTSTSHSANDSGFNHTADAKMTSSNNLPDKIIDNIKKYDIVKDRKETVQDTKEIVNGEILGWLQDYIKALEKGDIKTLRELGHISTEKEEKKLQQHYLYVRDVNMSVKNEVIDISDISNDQSQVTISFDRVDEWTDERGNRHSEVLPRITKTLCKEDGVWKIVKKNNELTRQAILYKKYKDMVDNITVKYGGLLEQINDRFRK